jgi:hypothetical protein
MTNQNGSKLPKNQTCHRHLGAGKHLRSFGVLTLKEKFIPIFTYNTYLQMKKLSLRRSDPVQGHKIHK